MYNPRTGTWYGADGTTIDLPANTTNGDIIDATENLGFMNRITLSTNELPVVPQFRNVALPGNNQLYLYYWADGWNETLVYEEEFYGGMIAIHERGTYVFHTDSSFSGEARVSFSQDMGASGWLMSDLSQGWNGLPPRFDKLYFKETGIFRFKYQQQGENPQPLYWAEWDGKITWSQKTYPEPFIQNDSIQTTAAILPHKRYRTQIKDWGQVVTYTRITVDAQISPGANITFVIQASDDNFDTIKDELAIDVYNGVMPYDTSCLKPSRYTRMDMIFDTSTSLNVNAFELFVDTSAPPVRADLDDDADVDGDDFQVFVSCFNGSLRPPKQTCTNLHADLDCDGDVDVSDFLTFSSCFNHVGNSPRCP